MPRSTIVLLTFTSLTLFSAGCARYSANSFRTASSDFPSQRTTRGCLDIAISAAHDSHADGPVLDIYLGNRCDDAVWVDLTGLGIYAQLADGQRLPVRLYDPLGELRAAVLGGREQVMERIEVEAPYESVALCANLEEFSFSISGGPPQILCTDVVGA